MLSMTIYAPCGGLRPAFDALTNAWADATSVTDDHSVQYGDGKWYVDASESTNYIDESDLQDIRDASSDAWLQLLPNPSGLVLSSNSNNRFAEALRALSHVAGLWFLLPSGSVVSASELGSKLADETWPSL